MRRGVAGRAVSRRQCMLVFVDSPFRTDLPTDLVVHRDFYLRLVIERSLPGYRKLVHNVFEVQSLSLSAPTPTFDLGGASFLDSYVVIN